MGGASRGTFRQIQGAHWGHRLVGAAGGTELFRRPESKAVTRVFSWWRLRCVNGRVSPLLRWGR